MRSNHSKLWKSRRSSLGKKESRLQSELETVSSAFEGKARNVLIGVAIVGVAAIAIKMATSSKKKKENPKTKKKENPQKEKIVARSSVSVKNMVLEKLITTVLSIFLSQLGQILKPSKPPEDKD